MQERRRLYSRDDGRGTLTWPHSISRITSACLASQIALGVLASKSNQWGQFFKGRSIPPSPGSQSTVKISAKWGWRGSGQRMASVCFVSQLTLNFWLSFKWQLDKADTNQSNKKVENAVAVLIGFETWLVHVVFANFIQEMLSCCVPILYMWMKITHSKKALDEVRDSQRCECVFLTKTVCSRFTSGIPMKIKRLFLNNKPKTL